jgi:hypothetical protein
MKKIFLYALFVLSLALTACSSQESTSDDGETKNDADDVAEVNSESKKSETPLSKDEFEKMYSDPIEYKGSQVEFYAKIFVEPEKDSDGTYLQAYVNNNSDRNIIIAINDPNSEVKIDDAILVKGTVEDVFEGENLMGGTITAPMILADNIEVVDYASAFSPALKIVEINKEMEQHGYLLKVNKMEVAEKETRLYLTVENKSQDTITFYDFNSKIIVDNKQLEPTSNYESNYPELQSEILPGIVTEGIIVFPAVSETGNVKLYLEGSSEDYMLDFEPFQFDITY